MFQVQDSKGEVYTVYSVRADFKNPSFLLFIDGKWVWETSRWYTPYHG